METIFIIILSIILIIIQLSFEYNIDSFDNTLTNKTNDLKILLDDLEYYKKFYKSKKIDSLINNNKLKSIKIKKNKILFITFDNRKNQEYVQIHNANINKYVEKFGYEYKFYT